MDTQCRTLLKLMRRQELSQTDLAQRLGIKRQTVSSWFSRGHIPPRNLSQLSVVLGAPMEELVEGPTNASYELSQLLKAYYCLSARSRVAVLSIAMALLDAESQREYDPTHENGLPASIRTSVGVARRKTA